MTDNTELKRLAEHHHSLGHAYTVATPSAVLALIAEKDAMAGLLKRFVDGEHEQDENQAERHMYFTEAQSLLALVNGELEAHTIVPDSAIKALNAERDQLKDEIEALRQDAERYRRMRSAAPKQADVLADEFDAEFDLQLDAALGKEVQS